MDRIKDMASGMNPVDLQKYVQDVKFPASKDDLVSQVQSKGAPSDIVDKIKNSKMTEFKGVQDVMSAVQGG